MTLICILTLFCLVSGFVTYGLGIFAYAKNPASRINRLFLAVMLAATYWAFGEFLIWQAGTADGVLFWLKVSSFWPVVIVLTVHFVLAFTAHPLAKPEQAVRPVLLLYIPALFFSLLGVFTDTLYVVENLPGTGFVYVPAQGILSILSSLFIIVVMGYATYACFLAWRRAPKGKIRRQNRLVMASICVTVIFGALSGLILPVLGISLPNLVFIGIVLFSIIIAYAVLRYGLFTLSPETAVPDLIRMMPDGMILADLKGRIITSNTTAAQILMDDESDLTGRLVEQLLPPPAYRFLYQSLQENGIVRDYEVLLDPALQTIVSISGSVVRDPEGESAGAILIIRDITSRKSSEKALAVANEKISLLSQLTRHDISNLITALDGYLLLLQERKASQEDDAYISSCIEIVEKISRQLQFSREYHIIGMHRPVWQPLRGIVDRAVSDVSHAGIGISVTVPPVEIYADPLVVKVIYNILENAVRHGEHLTAIQVSAIVMQTREFVLVIEDDGIGIPVSDKDRIFRYGIGKNTGLGLALSRDILSVTDIRLTETGIPGKGARFELIIPASGWRSL